MDTDFETAKPEPDGKGWQPAQQSFARDFPLFINNSF